MPYLITKMLTPTLSPQATLGEMTTALAGLVEEILVLHDSAFEDSVVTYYSDEIVSNAPRDRAQRLAQMGDPARYAEVMPAEDYDAGEGFDGRPVRRFDVFLYYGVGRNASRAEASAAFRSILENVSASTPGLFYAIREQGVLIAATDHELDMRIEGRPRQRFVNLDPKNYDHRHEAHATVLLG